MTKSMRMSHPGTRARTVLAALLMTTALAGITTLVHAVLFRPTTITAYFTKATAIYSGDAVQVAGVTVGHITGIDGEGTRVKVTLRVDHEVPIPSTAKAVIVSQNLIAARYIELTPAYGDADGPTMGDGAIIPLDRTAVPVEWDEVKDQLMHLATDLGPRGRAPSSLARFVDSAADALGGNGSKLHELIAQLASVSRVLADGGANIVDIITNLQTLVTTLRDSNTQIVQFQDRFATLTSVLDESRSDLDAALTNLSSALTDVQRFVAGTRNPASEQVQRLANVTQNLVDHKTDLKNVLHVAPNAIGNAYNIYNPDSGDVSGSFVLTNFANPMHFICSAIGAVENATSPETSKLCAQFLGAGLQSLSFNGLPVPINPFLAASASPDNIVYSDPKMAPGGSGPSPAAPEQPPAISAYQPMGPQALPGLLLPGNLSPNRSGDDASTPKLPS